MTVWRWLTPWDPSPFTAVILIATGLVYALQCRGDAFWQKICFWIGFFSVFAVLLTRFDFYAEHEFFMQRIQQATLQHFGTFLVALALAGKRLRWVVHPITAVIMFDGLIILSLIPQVQFLAMIDWRLYRLMNLGMTLSGLLFWHTALEKRTYGPGVHIAMMLAAIPPQIAAGMVLVFAPHSLYPVYDLCGRAFGGLTQLQDQQIGGVIVWIHGAMMSIIGILIVAMRDLRRKPAFI
jgi:putative membrane protein